MSINWDEKPDWADAWVEDLTSPNLSRWHRHCKDTNLYYDVRGSYYPASYKDIAIHYPPETKPEWNGEGLPPVGTVCEGCVSISGVLQWQKLEILKHQNDRNADYAVLVFEDNTLMWCDRDQLRPIKSDKEKWVEQASKTFHTGKPFPNCLGAVYDALISGELPIPEVRK